MSPAAFCCRASSFGYIKITIKSVSRCIIFEFLYMPPHFGPVSAEVLQKILYLEIFWGFGTRNRLPCGTVPSRAGGRPGMGGRAPGHGGRAPGHGRAGAWAWRAGARAWAGVRLGMGGCAPGCGRVCAWAWAGVCLGVGGCAPRHGRGISWRNTRWYARACGRLLVFA